MRKMTKTLYKSEMEYCIRSSSKIELYTKHSSWGGTEKVIIAFYLIDSEPVAKVCESFSEYKDQVKGIKIFRDLKIKRKSDIPEDPEKITIKLTKQKIDSIINEL